MSDVEQLCKRMQHRNIKKTASASGVHPNSLYKIINKKTNPKCETVKKVLDYLNKIEGQKNG